MTYTYDELISAYQGLGVADGQTVYVTSDLVKLGAFAEGRREAVLDAHLRALQALVGETGTIVVPTATMNLINTDNVFDVNETPSFQRGVFSEYVRTQPGALRSFHPFVSYAALGAKAALLTENVSRHAFGPETPESRMADDDALALSIGLHPRITCSAIHGVEQMMGVPYRYTKEFEHPVVREGSIETECYYMFVWYRDIGVTRDDNRKLFDRIGEGLGMRETEIGRGSIYAYRVAEFQRLAIKAIAQDIYIWCKDPPGERPYRD